MGLTLVVAGVIVLIVVSAERRRIFSPRITFSKPTSK
jgi:hypothetical protein